MRSVKERTPPAGTGGVSDEHSNEQVRHSAYLNHPIFLPTETLDRTLELVALAEDLRSHARVAHLVAAQSLGDFLHVSGLGWFSWNGKRFEIDTEGKGVTRRIIEVVGELSVGAKRELANDLRSAQSDGGLRGVARVMSALPDFSVHANELDANSKLLNVQNGILDLESLRLLPHDSKYRMTMIARASFDPSAQSQELDNFFASSLPDVDVRGYLQTACGVGLLGEQVQHVFPMLIGAGRNGKGVFYNALHHALGDYSHVADSSLLDVVDGDPNRPNPAALELRGKRFVWLSETANSAVLDAAKVKRYTGGDPITARGVYGKSNITFDPSHQLFLITNHAPQLPADDPAVWARMRLVPWEVVIPESQRDPDLPAKLREASDALLAWAVAGLRNYQMHGFAEPAAVSSATATYQGAQDTVGNFIVERCNEVLKGQGSAPRDLHRGYLAHCRANAVLPQHQLGEREFGKRLDDLGFPVKRIGAQRYRDGLQLDPSFT